LVKFRQRHDIFNFQVHAPPIESFQVNPGAKPIAPRKPRHKEGKPAKSNLKPLEKWKYPEPSSGFGTQILNHTRIDIEINADRRFLVNEAGDLINKVDPEEVGDEKENDSDDDMNNDEENKLNGTGNTNNKGVENGDNTNKARKGKTFTDDVDKGKDVDNDDDSDMEDAKVISSSTSTATIVNPPTDSENQPTNKVQFSKATKNDTEAKNSDPGNKDSLENGNENGTLIMNDDKGKAVNDDSTLKGSGSQNTVLESTTQAKEVDISLDTNASKNSKDSISNLPAAVMPNVDVSIDCDVSSSSISNGTTSTLAKVGKNTNDATIVITSSNNRGDKMVSAATVLALNSQEVPPLTSSIPNS